MGTRADFYLGTDPASMEWLGSVAYDGYAIADTPDRDPLDRAVARAKNAEVFYRAVATLLAENEHATLKEQGWPWPWKDSRGTDYAYCFDGTHTVYYCFGHGPQHPGKSVFTKYGNYKRPFLVKASFPDMTQYQRIASGSRSGLLILGVSQRIVD